MPGNRARRCEQVAITLYRAPPSSARYAFRIFLQDWNGTPLVGLDRTRQLHAQFAPQTFSGAHMSASHQVTDGTLAAGERVTTFMTQGGAAVTIIGGLTVQEWAMAIGVFVSIVGLLGNWAIAWYWKSKHYQLELERAEGSSPRRPGVDVDRREGGSHGGE